MVSPMVPPRAKVRSGGCRAIAVLTLLTLAPALLDAQQAMRYGVVMDQARNALAAVWTEDIHQVERAYCVTQWWAATRAPRHTSDSTTDTVFRVLAIEPGEQTDATPNSATFTCPPGEPELHTHPPATCYADRQDQCYQGGTDAYSCQPSREDVRTLLSRRDAFAIVQCDRNAFVFYYPAQYEAAAQPPPTLAASPPHIRDPYSDVGRPTTAVNKP
jgi:hypothetical protein